MDEAIGGKKKRKERKRTVLSSNLAWKKSGGGRNRGGATHALQLWTGGTRQGDPPHPNAFSPPASLFPVPGLDRKQGERWVAADRDAEGGGLYSRCPRATQVSKKAVEICALHQAVFPIQNSQMKTGPKKRNHVILLNLCFLFFFFSSLHGSAGFCYSCSSCSQ